jgi:hypothetical protein
MDVRLFKLLVFLGTEAVLAAIYFLSEKIGAEIPYYGIFHYANFLLICAAALLLLLPEDNWIWIVEDNPRIRKISLRSKSIKHLHLSMLYLFGLTFPPFLFCLAFMIKEQNPYRYPLSWFFIGGAAVYGVFCAWKNNRNVRKYESLFAVAWDRRAVFLEIFVGFRVTKDPFFFYSGLSLILGFILLIGNILGPLIYRHYIGRWNNEFDDQKNVVMTMLFHFFLITGIWVAVMYATFQIFFARRLERWSKETGGKRNY